MSRMEWTDMPLSKGQKAPDRKLQFEVLAMLVLFAILAYLYFSNRPPAVPQASVTKSSESDIKAALRSLTADGMKSALSPEEERAALDGLSAPAGAKAVRTLK